MKIIHTTNRAHADFLDLVNQLDRHLEQQAAGRYDRTVYQPFNNLDDIKDVFIAYRGEEAVGCASFLEYEPGTAEIKKVFVKDAYRGQNVARQLMAALQEEAARQGCHTLILETGVTLTGAIRLYRKLGFDFIPNYGPYVDLPISVCLGKTISRPAA